METSAVKFRHLWKQYYIYDGSLMNNVTLKIGARGNKSLRQLSIRINLTLRFWEKSSDSNWKFWIDIQVNPKSPDRGSFIFLHSLLLYVSSFAMNSILFSSAIFLSLAYVIIDLGLPLRRMNDSKQQIEKNRVDDHSVVQNHHQLKKAYSVW